MRSMGSGGPAELLLDAPAPVKKRLEWSTLLLFVLGLCSLASPHLMRQAHVHHTGSSGSPASHAGRTSQRSASRTSSRGGVQSELDRDRLHDALHGDRRDPPRIGGTGAACSAALPAAMPRYASAVRVGWVRAAEVAGIMSPALSRSRGRAPPTA